MSDPRENLDPVEMLILGNLDVADGFRQFTAAEDKALRYHREIKQCCRNILDCRAAQGIDDTRSMDRLDDLLRRGYAALVEPAFNPPAKAM